MNQRKKSVKRRKNTIPAIDIPQRLKIAEGIIGRSLKIIDSEEEKQKAVDIIYDFATNLLELENKIEYKMLILNIAINCWNASWLPEERRYHVLEDYLMHISPKDTNRREAIRKECLKLLDRKEEIFADYRQYFLHTEFSVTNDILNLQTICAEVQD
jgi:hypothetical protein